MVAHIGGGTLRLPWCQDTIMTARYHFLKRPPKNLKFTPWKFGIDTNNDRSFEKVSWLFSVSMWLFRVKKSIKFHCFHPGIKLSKANTLNLACYKTFNFTLASTPLKTNITLENPMFNRKYIFIHGGCSIVMLVFFFFFLGGGGLSLEKNLPSVVKWPNVPKGRGHL